MRTLKITTSVVMSAVLLLFINSLHAQTPEDATLIVSDNQIADCTTTGLHEIVRDSVNTILEEDYPFLKSVNCLKNKDFLDSRAWNWTLKNIPDGVQHHSFGWQFRTSVEFQRVR